MEVWEFNVLVMDIGNASGLIKVPNINEIWGKLGPDGRTHWDRLQQLGHEGWELVNTFPVAVQGTTFQMVWTFKRRIRTA